MIQIRKSYNWSIFNHITRFNTTCPLIEIGHCHLPLHCRCKPLLVKNTHSCGICAEPFSSGTSQLICARCQKNPPSFDRVFAPYIFAPPLQFAVHDFKYNKQQHFARFFAALMDDALPAQISIDTLVFVPMLAKQEMTRGFNQSERIAHYLAEARLLPLAHNLVRRVRHAEKQSTLDIRERRRNLHGAFHSQDVSGLAVAIIDDVVTTGATANELAKTLKAKGATRVEVWAPCRTPRLG